MSKVALERKEVRKRLEVGKGKMQVSGRFVLNWHAHVGVGEVRPGNLFGFLFVLFFKA